MKYILILSCIWNACIIMCGCGQSAEADNTQHDIPQEETEGKTLVVYFSHQVPYEVDGVTGASFVATENGYQGSTEYIARCIQEQTGGDLFRITVAEDHYPATYEALAEVAKEEHDKGILPSLNSRIDNIGDYSTVILGYPIWWYDIPMPVRSFLEQYDLSGKRIAVFTTHLGSGLSGTIPSIAEMEPDATVISEGYSCSGDNVSGKENEIASWLEKLGYHK